MMIGMDCVEVIMHARRTISYPCLVSSSLIALPPISPFPLTLKLTYLAVLHTTVYIVAYISPRFPRILEPELIVNHHYSLFFWRRKLETIDNAMPCGGASKLSSYLSNQPDNIRAHVQRVRFAQRQT